MDNVDEILLELCQSINALKVGDRSLRSMDQRLNRAVFQAEKYLEHRGR